MISSHSSAVLPNSWGQAANKIVGLTRKDSSWQARQRCTKGVMPPLGPHRRYLIIPLCFPPSCRVCVGGQRRQARQSIVRADCEPRIRGVELVGSTPVFKCAMRLKLLSQRLMHLFAARPVFGPEGTPELPAREAQYCSVARPTQKPEELHRYAGSALRLLRVYERYHHSAILYGVC